MPTFRSFRPLPAVALAAILVSLLTLSGAASGQTPTPTSTLFPPAELTLTAGVALTASAVSPTPIRVNGIAATQLIPLPAGVFRMGTTREEAAQAIRDCLERDQGPRCNPRFVEDALPAFDVYLDSFAMERYEVTYEQYIAFLNALGPGSHHLGCDGLPCAAVRGTNGPFVQPNSYILFDGQQYRLSTALYRDRPASFVTWYGAKAYCEALGRRLPTEAEWEYAARGDQALIYPWGNTWDANRALTSRPTNQGGPAPVTAYPNGVSPFGIANMAGNVAEWVADWYDPFWYGRQRVGTPTNNPGGPTTGNLKVTRGGSWDSLPLFARAVHRGDLRPEVAFPSVGFRCAARSAIAPSATPTGNVETRAAATLAVRATLTAQTFITLTPTASPTFTPSRTVTPSQTPDEQRTVEAIVAATETANAIASRTKAP